MALTCVCGYGDYTETPSGGALLAGTARVTTSREYPSGGAKCAGTATVSTNQLWENYATVYHLIELANGTDGEYKDSANNINARGNGGGAGTFSGNSNAVPTRGRGIFDYSQVFNGAQYITCPKDSLADQSDLTVSLWAKPTGSFLDRCFYSRGQTILNITGTGFGTTTSTGEGYSITIGHGGRDGTFASGGDILTTRATVKVQGASDWTTYNLSGDVLTTGCWYHFAVVISSGHSVSLYINGTLQQTTAITETALVPSSKGAYIGRVDNRNFAEGYIQEVRTAAVARDSNWLETEYHNLCDTGFITQGTVQTYGYS